MAITGFAIFSNIAINGGSSSDNLGWQIAKGPLQIIFGIVGGIIGGIVLGCTRIFDSRLKRIVGIFSGGEHARAGVRCGLWPFCCVCGCVRACVCAFVCVCTPARVRTCAPVRMRMCAPACMRACEHVRDAGRLHGLDSTDPDHGAGELRAMPKTADPPSATSAASCTLPSQVCSSCSSSSTTACCPAARSAR